MDGQIETFGREGGKGPPRLDGSGVLTEFNVTDREEGAV